VGNHVGLVGNFRWGYSAEQDWALGWRARGWHVTTLEEAQATADDVLGLADRVDVLMWVSSSTRLTAEVMVEAGERCTTVGWHADLFHGLSRRGRWQDKPTWAARWVFTADGGNDDLFAAMGVEHRWLLPGVRHTLVGDLGRFRQSMSCDVAFVGNDGRSYHPEWPYRAELVSQLRAMCDRNGWRFRNPGGADRTVERSGRMTDFYASAKVTVGDSLCFDRDDARYWSDRVYEATGRGGVLVMPHIDRLDAQFAGGLPMYPWGDWEALEAIVGGLVGDRGERARVADRCRGVTGRDHTYLSRVDELLEVIG